MNSSAAHAVKTSAPALLWSLASYQPAPRDARRLVVAVATAGGAHVDRNFEDAEAFLLYEKFEGDTCFIGRQPCRRTTADGDPLARTRLLADCDMVLCANITDTCRQTLSTLGIDCNLAHAGAAVCDAVAAL